MRAGHRHRAGSVSRATACRAVGPHGTSNASSTNRPPYTAATGGTTRPSTAPAPARELPDLPCPNVTIPMLRKLAAGRHPPGFSPPRREAEGPGEGRVTFAWPQASRVHRPHGRRPFAMSGRGLRGRDMRDACRHEFTRPGAGLRRRRPTRRRRGRRGSRRRASRFTLRSAFSTVEWFRPPKCPPISRVAASVCLRARCIATIRGPGDACGAPDFWSGSASAESPAASQTARSTSASNRTRAGAVAFEVPQHLAGGRQRDRPCRSSPATSPGSTARPSSSRTLARNRPATHFSASAGDGQVPALAPCAAGSPAAWSSRRAGRAGRRGRRTDASPVRPASS